MSLIIPANTLASGGFAVDNSLRFNDGSSDYLTRTPSSTSNQKTWTVSCWVKRSKLSSNQYVWGVNGDTNGDYFTELLFNSSDELEFRQGGTVGDPYQTQYKTNRLFRDVSAWYHIVIAADTTNGTEADRLKIWINGVQETSFATTNHPSLNENFRWHFVSGSNYPHSIGRSGRHSTNYFGGYIAEWIDVDGSQLDATSFGEFDEDSGIWKPIDVSGLTFGTNGAYLDFEDSAALGDDVSGNGNDFTVNNLTAIDQTTDTPTNNFATLNPLDQTIVGGSSATMTNGNLTWQSSGDNTSQNAMRGTLGLTQGKWYWEVKYTAASSGDDFSVGICGSEANLNVGASGDILEGANPNVMWLNRASNSSVRKNSSDVTTGLTDANIGDIIMLAVDMDNLKFFVGINGTWLNSANPVTGDNAPSTIDANTYLPAVSDFGYDNQQTLSFNFGSPPFTISSGNTDGNGYGNFEYAVPSGYLSLCTKNLSEVLG
jgi:hypothetical protein